MTFLFCHTIELYLKAFLRGAGLCVRRELRSNKDLRRWIKYTALDCGDCRTSTVKLKANPNPTRTGLDLAVLPERSYARRPARVY